MRIAIHILEGITMTDEEKQNLNVKLAKWLGWEVIYDGYGFWWRVNNQASGWGTSTSLPKFTDSLDACFNWLILRLFELDLEYRLYSDDGYHFCQIKKQFANDVIADSKGGHLNPALALCVAIENLKI